jgi:hypothetical protein
MFMSATSLRSLVKCVFEDAAERYIVLQAVEFACVIRISRILPAIHRRAVAMTIEGVYSSSHRNTAMLLKKNWNTS